MTTIFNQKKLRTIAYKYGLHNMQSTNSPFTLIWTYDKILSDWKEEEFIKEIKPFIGSTIQVNGHIPALNHYIVTLSEKPKGAVA